MKVYIIYEIFQWEADNVFEIYLDETKANNRLKEINEKHKEELRKKYNKKKRYEDEFYMVSYEVIK